jgi:Rad3-related DNA helicase
MPLASRVTSLLSRGGRVAARWPRWEERAGQIELAATIAATIEHGGVLLAEAPTGVGKSLAYLLPAVLHTLESERRVVVATCTRSLQDQLFERDLPAVLEALDVTLPCARLKGKQNYVCPRALELAEGQGPEEHDVLDRLRAWASDDDEGDLDRFIADDPEALRRVRGRVATDPAACTMLTCRRGRECHWVRARRLAAQERIVVVNHALLALSGEVDGLLPEFDVLVVDEAHRLEGVLLQQLEKTASRHRIEELLRMVGTGRRGTGGLLARVRGYALPLFERAGAAGAEAAEDMEALARRVGEARDDAERLFAVVEAGLAAHRDRSGPYGARARYRSAEELLGRDLEPLEVAIGHCTAFARALHRTAERVGDAGRGGAGEELAAELEQVAARFGVLGADLEALGDAREANWVYWRTAGPRGVELHGAPITVGDHARRLVIGRGQSAILTSATLSAGGEFAFVAERLGLGETHGMPYEVVRVPSPFPLERQMEAWVYEGGGEEADAVAGLVVALVGAGPPRNVLVLFTAHERLRRARTLLQARLPARVPVLAQDRDGPAGVLAERFRLERGAVLLGVQSLWEGVDFPGEALEILVVAKLPFSVPDEPLVEARAERLRDRGEDPFRADAVPEAVLRFRQGVGRLIRRSDDRGVLVVCDPRLVTAGYRRPFLDALPVAPRPARDPHAIARAAAQFLASPVEDAAR